MKSIYKIIACSLVALSAISCGEDPLSKEQYKKEVYLVGAFNRVWTIDVKYQNETVEDFFTITSSGTVSLDKDIKTSVEINEGLVSLYNRKFLGELNEDKFFEPLEQALYNIPSKDNIVIKHTENFYVRVPIFLDTKNLEVDHRYVIPIQLGETSPYEVNGSGRKMLISLNLTNDYSGNYQLDGTMTTTDGKISKIKKNKVVTATGINTVRVFYGALNESSKKEDIAKNTIEIEILDEFIEGSTNVKKIKGKGWGNLEITDSGTGTYNMTSKMFKFSYTTVADGTVFVENLTAEKEIL